MIDIDRTEIFKESASAKKFCRTIKKLFYFIREKDFIDRVYVYCAIKINEFDSTRIIKPRYEKSDLIFGFDFLIDNLQQLVF